MKRLLNERVDNRDSYPATSRYRHSRHYKREIRRGVYRVEPETWVAPVIPESELTRMTTVGSGEVGALDLISERLYGTDRLWWILAVANGIIDPFTEVTSGKELKFPTFSYVVSNILV